MFPLIAGHASCSNKNIKMRFILFILHIGLFIIGVQFKLSTIFLSLINSSIFIILCFENYSCLNIILSFCLSYIINNIYPYCHLLVYLSYYIMNDIAYLMNKNMAYGDSFSALRMQTSY